jgi:hypothetical protein
MPPAAGVASVNTGEDFEMTGLTIEAEDWARTVKPFATTSKRKRSFFIMTIYSCAENYNAIK